MKARSTQITGASQWSGKTTWMLSQDFYRHCEAADTAIAVFDTHRTFGEKCAGHAIEMGRGGDTIFVDLGSKFLGGPGITLRSTATDPFEKARDNREYARAAGSAMTLHRPGASLDQTRTTKEFFLLAFRAWQLTNLPAPLMMNFLRPWTTSFDLQYNQLPEGDIKDKLKGVKMMGNSTTFHTLVGPALRLLEELFEEPIFANLLDATFNLEPFIRNCGIFIVIGSGDKFVDRVIMRMFRFRYSQAIRKNWALTEEPLPCRIYIDEASKMIGEAEAEDLAECLKMGLSHVIASQIADYGDPVVTQMVEENTQEKVFMHPGSMKSAEDAAKHLSFNLNPWMVHHQTTQRHTEDDGYRIVQTISTGEREGDKRVNDSIITKRKLVEEKQDHYFSLTDQQTMNRVELMRLGTGWAYIRRGPVLIGPDYYEPKPPPFGYDKACKPYIEELIQRRVEQGILRLAKLWASSSTPTTTVPPSNTNGKPSNNGHQNGKPRKKKISPSLKRRN